MKARIGFRLGPSQRHGIGVFATCDMKAGAILGTIYLKNLGHVDSFATLPMTGVVRGTDILAITGGGFPYWYLNYTSFGNAAVFGNEVRLIENVYKGDELLISVPSTQLWSQVEQVSP